MPEPKADKTADVRIAAAEFVAGAHERNQIPAAFEDAPEVAFAGKSNVGKSSLLNMVLARKSLARTSNTPGRTRQVNFFDVKLATASGGSRQHGVEDITLAQPPVRRLVFVDLPGYGYAKVSKAEAHGWKDLIEGYLEGRSTLKAIYVLVDVRRGIEPDDEELVEYAASLASRPRVAIVVTKLDKLARSAQKPALAKIAAGRGVHVIGTSAETRDGRDVLWKSILSACGVASKA